MGRPCLIAAIPVFIALTVGLVRVHIAKRLIIILFLRQKHNIAPIKRAMAQHPHPFALAGKDKLVVKFGAKEIGRAEIRDHQLMLGQRLICFIIAINHIHIAQQNINFVFLCSALGNLFGNGIYFSNALRLFRPPIRPVKHMHRAQNKPKPLRLKRRKKRRASKLQAIDQRFIRQHNFANEIAKKHPVAII